MPQLYIFIAASLIIAIIVVRRGYIYDRVKKLRFREDVKKKVDELHVERQQMQKERFKDNYMNEQQGKKYDFAQYKLNLRQADVAIAKEQWSEAKKLLIHSMSLTKDETLVSLKLASVYMESGDLKRAETIYKRLLEADKTNPSIYENLAKIYTKRKQFKEAVYAYVQALELDEKDDKKLISLGKLYSLLMRHSLAAECFRRAAELRPREVEYLFFLAEACMNDGDFENALFTYEKILTVEPYNDRARNAAQDVRIRMNEMEKLMSN